MPVFSNRCLTSPKINVLFDIDFVEAYAMSAESHPLHSTLIFNLFHYGFVQKHGGRLLLLESFLA